MIVDGKKNEKKVEILPRTANFEAQYGTTFGSPMTPHIEDRAIT